MWRISVDNIENHDRSKYDEYEFEQYRRFLYPIDEEEKKNAQKDFDAAWRHHYTVNQHHWDHYVGANGIPKEMPMTYLLEMVADWQAMGYVFGNNAYEFYKKEMKNDKLNLHSNTNKKLIKLLECL